MPMERSHRDGRRRHEQHGKHQTRVRLGRPGMAAGVAGRGQSDGGRRRWRDHGGVGERTGKAVALTSALVRRRRRSDDDDAER
jgi:hypothetical protein